MEKKKYIKPEITVVKIDGDCRILAGSDTIKCAAEDDVYDESWDNYVD
ncbi:MAG: hypothetical protein Q4F85_08380 [Prevotella sp.]|nr:hypothetical protein [Prevotella sp.]